MQESRTASATSTQGDQKSIKPTEKSIPIYMLFKYADGIDIVLMIVGSICAIANGLSQPIMALLFGGVVDIFSTTDSHHIVQEVSQVSFKLLYLAIGAGIAAFLQILSWNVTGERQAARLQGLYLKTVLRQEIGFFDSEMTMGQVIGMMSSDAIIIQDAISEKIGKAIQLMSTFLGGFVFAFDRGWLLALVLVSMIPALVIVGGFMAIIIAKMSVRAQAASSEARNIVEETVGAIRTVASLTAEKEAISKYAKKVEMACAFSIQQGLVAGLGLGIVSFIIFSGYGLAIWYGSKLVLDKGYKGGQVISILTAMVYSGMALGQTSSCLKALAVGQAAASKMFHTINRKPQIDADDTAGIVLEDIRGEIEFKDVHFRYPARSNVEIFSGLSLHIPGGTTVALVGKSGSGKSTVISLLERFYDPDAGEIMIDGVNLKKLQLRWLREKIGLVSQEPVLFATTIRENIAYGKENATEDEIEKALQYANAAAFIKDLPMGLDTMVGARGTQLSGGQKQRIAIARVILKDPRIFLLDEVTSALDNKTEKATHAALSKVASNRTTIIVAHHLYSVENVNCLAVMHQGKIVEQGTHAELIGDQDGHYFKLVCSQGTEHVKNVKETRLLREESINNMNETPKKGESWIPSMQSSTMQVLSRTRHSLPGSGNASARINYVENNKKRELSFKKNGKVSIKLLAELTKAEVPILLLGTISAIVHGLAFPIFGFLFSTAIKTFYEPPIKQRKDASYWALMYTILGLVTLLAVLAQNYSFGAASCKLKRKVCLGSFEKVVYQDIRWFDDPLNSSGAISARLSTNASTLQSLLGDGLALIVQNMATVVAGVFMAFMENSMLALILVALSSIVAVQSLFETKAHRMFTADAQLMYEEQSQVASDAIGSIRSVASFCAENKVMDLYKKKSSTKMKYWIRLGTIRSINCGISQLAFYSINALCFYVGAILVQHNKATVPEVFKVYLALIVSAIGITAGSGMALDMNKATALARSVCEILNSKPKIDSSSTKGMKLENLAGDIEFKHVRFTYPSRPNVLVLKDLCLSIPAGKTVVVVGESGNGKSTLVCLLERFYDVNSGSVLLDGINIQKYKLNWLRQQMGLVSQEPVLFDDSIRANIAYSTEGNTTEDEIVAAAKLANAHNFIAALPNGYDTEVGGFGVQLSGGQKQRIAIARAVVKNPKILLLDEATSALDAESENAVQDALNQAMIGKTTMVVTHRLSKIRPSDIIAFLKDGVITEKGKHDELIKLKNGGYASLVANHMNHSK